MQTNITATVFGGSGDRETSAYDGHRITNAELCCALPYHFHGKPPKVVVHHSGKSVEVKIEDIGPWNTNDPYWLHGRRPQAESGRDHFGRKTNHAGIDLSPAAAHALGISGMGKVDWEFVDEGK